eukprot:CAMPEP_0114356108 /NCGR_PEP_ID=MMETSP0101-20121206/20726_1 /TAXON_ID=38822 ORGANISM="Pteridomonas danica, Strain PT" /NCGR_SAMPLE_ID=MMETSP0101 /ASSEMBLY_ACC=CAM_ASM_000211 /LENGTH=591 /DNA_ID=CAMNT_0001498399 /DNA_START=36 /DNA_END=1812 /DNA_ORIENTATION=+
MVIPQEYFQDFSLSHSNGSYFLRTDRLLACFLIESSSSISRLGDSQSQIESERIKDAEVTEIMQFHDSNKQQNEKLIGDIFHYGKLAEIEKYVRCGIPVFKQPNTVSDNQHATTSNNRPLNQSDNNSSLGILFTSHHPDELSDEEIELFGSCEAFLACLLPTKLLFQHKVLKTPLHSKSFNMQNVIHKFRYSRKSYNALSSEESSLILRSNMFYLPTEILTAMRGLYHEKVLDPVPWYEGIILLPPHNIKSAYQIMSEDNIDIFSSSLPTFNSHNCVVDTPLVIERYMDSFSSDQSSSSLFSLAPSSRVVPIVPIKVIMIDDNVTQQQQQQQQQQQETTKLDDMANVLQTRRFFTKRKFIEPFVSLKNLQSKLEIIIKQCYENNLFPLYHYTDVKTAKIISRRGFKVSHQGNGGGLYFSTKSPTTYHLDDTNTFEDQIIIDFFGEGVLDNYRGQQKVDVCIVYGMDSLLVELTTRKKYGGSDGSGGGGGGRYIDDEKETHLRLLPRDRFKDFSLPHQDSHYYLRSDRVMGAFLLTKRNAVPKVSTSYEMNNVNDNTRLFSRNENRIACEKTNSNSLSSEENFYIGIQEVDL